MAIYNDSVQTDAGRALENRARSGEGVMEFTYIKTGSGTYSEDEKKGIKQVSDLKSPKQSFAFSGIRLENGGDYLSLESVIKNEGMEEGYYLSEIGIYARLVGMEESILYCIGLVDEPDYIPEQMGEKIYEIALQSLVKCYDAANVTIQYENTTYATAKSLMDHIADLANPHKVTAEQLGIDPTPDMDKPVSRAQQAALDALYQQLTAYTKQEIANLINGAPESLDTLKEVSDAIAAHKTIMDALDAAIGKKASVAEFDSHIKDTTKHIMPNERAAWNDKMETTGDSANNTTTFTSGDEANPTGWADIGLAASGEKHSSLMRKFSLSIKNVRYLWKLLGSTSLSGIGDGTVTGAINALNTGLQVKTISVIPNSDYLFTLTGKRIGGMIAINFISEWKQWSPGRIIVGHTGIEPIVFVSREAILIEGQSGSVLGMCNISIYGSGGNIEVVIPDDWQDGKFAHLCGTIVFLG